MPPHPPPSAARSAPFADALLLVACIVAAGTASILAGQDSNWDLQNYHYYNPWAWLSGRIFGPDVAAAQLQTYHNPIFDVPFLALVELGWPPRAIAFALAIPTGIAAFFFVLILRLVFADLGRTERQVAIWTSFAIGVTSSMGHATLGTTMNEWIVVALTLAGVWLIVRAIVRHDGGNVPTGALLAAGALMGIATAGKLTGGSYAVAACVALVLRGPYAAHIGIRVREAVLFGCGVLAGFALGYGHWGYALWSHFASPVFPYGNEWIGSPWWSKASVIGRIYGPKQFLDWLRFPFDMYAPGPSFVGEVDYRDARMPLLYGLALVCGLVWLWVWIAQKGRLPAPPSEGVSRAWRFLTAFFILSFLLWTAQHSNYRYLVTLDVLSGALIITLIQRNLRPGHAPIIMIAVALFLVINTKPGSWGRVDFGERWFATNAPALAPDALVVTATGDPLAFLIPLLQPTPAKVVGISNNLVNPGRPARLYAEAGATIRAHQGPIYTLAGPGAADPYALAQQGLVRIVSTCVAVRTNMSRTPLELCRAARTMETTTPK